MTTEQEPATLSAHQFADRLTELFHPDMLYDDIVTAVKALLKLYSRDAAAEEMKRYPDEVLAECTRALWEDRPTHLEQEARGAQQQSQKPALPAGRLTSHKTAEALWDLLDRIDSFSDQLKPQTQAGYETFYHRALALAGRRHFFLKSDGQRLFWPPETLQEATAASDLEALQKFFPGMTQSEIHREIERLQTSDQNFSRFGAQAIGGQANAMIDRALKEPSLLSALMLLSNYDTENAVRQAMRNVPTDALHRTATGGLWDTFSGSYFKTLLEKWGIDAAMPRGAPMNHAPAPVPMILYCPVCHARHIDEGEFATKPHETHACQSCGLPWKPAKVATVGVEFLPGYKNAPSGKALAGKRVRVIPPQPEGKQEGVVGYFDGPYEDKSKELYHVVMGTYGLNLRREEFETL